MKKKERKKKSIRVNVSHVVERVEGTDFSFGVARRCNKTQPNSRIPIILQRRDGDARRGGESILFSFAASFVSLFSFQQHRVYNMIAFRRVFFFFYSVFSIR